MNRYKDILTTKKDHLEEEKNISVDERVDNLIKLKTIRKKHENILNIQIVQKKIGFLAICRNPYFIGISTLFFSRKKY